MKKPQKMAENRQKRPFLAVFRHFDPLNDVLMNILPLERVGSLKIHKKRLGSKKITRRIKLRPRKYKSPPFFECFQPPQDFDLLRKSYRTLF